LTSARISISLNTCSDFCRLGTCANAALPPLYDAFQIISVKCLQTGADSVGKYLYLYDPYLDEDLKYTNGIVLLNGFPYDYNGKSRSFFLEKRMTRKYMHSVKKSAEKLLCFMLSDNYEPTFTA
jgi:hypothetical protein